MDSKDIFINVLVAILIVSIVVYFINIIGLGNIPFDNCVITQTIGVQPTGITPSVDQNFKLDTSYIEDVNCVKERERKQRELSLKRSIILGLTGFILLLNKYYFPDLGVDLSIGFGLSGLILVLVAISSYFQYIPDIVKLLISSFLLYFVLKMYIDTKKNKI